MKFFCVCVSVVVVLRQFPLSRMLLFWRITIVFPHVLFTWTYNNSVFFCSPLFYLWNSMAFCLSVAGTNAKFAYTHIVCVCVCGWNRWYSRIFGIKQWLIFPLLPFGDYCYENGNNLLEAKRTVKRQFIKGTTVEQPNYLFVFGMEQLKPLRLLGWELIHFWLKCERIYLIWRRIDIVRKCIYIASQEKRFKDY